MTVQRYGPFPVRAFLTIVLVVCSGLAASTVYGYLMLARLRTEYLEHLAHDIAVSIESQARGPGRRQSPAFWQDMIEEAFRNISPSVAYVALVDKADRVLAGKSFLGRVNASSAPGFISMNRTKMFVLDFHLSSTKQGMLGVPTQVSGWRVQVGLYATAADFIQRQAILQVVLTCISIVTLLTLTYFLLQTLRRFVELKDREQSERHLKALGAMSAAMAHEIRNPLGAIKGLTQLVQEDLPQDHGAHSLMKTVVREAERLEALVSDLLDFSRFRRPSLGRFDYADLLDEVKKMLIHDLQEGRKTLEVSALDSLSVCSDESGLRQVLFNTLLNATDFTPEGGKIFVRARLEQDSRTLVTEIDDSGPGLGDRDPEELFEPFVTTKARGTGLGLAVSRQIVNNLGGKIHLANLPGGGARCTIRVPAGKEE